MPEGVGKRGGSRRKPKVPTQVRFFYFFFETKKMDILYCVAAFPFIVNCPFFFLVEHDAETMPCFCSPTIVATLQLHRAYWIMKFLNIQSTFLIPLQTQRLMQRGPELHGPTACVAQTHVLLLQVLLQRARCQQSQVAVQLQLPLVQLRSL